MVDVHQLFGNHIISKNDDIPWSSTYPDLTACDLFMRGYFRSKVYCSQPATIEKSKTRKRCNRQKFLLKCYFEPCAILLRDCMDIFTMKCHK